MNFQKVQKLAINNHKQMEFMVGGKYRIIKKIGSGAFGEVFNGKKLK